MVKYGHPHPQHHAIRGATMELHSQFQFAASIQNASRYHNSAAIILIKHYLAKIQYYTTVCIRHLQPNLSAKHVNAMEIAHGNGHAEWPYFL